MSILPVNISRIDSNTMSISITPERLPEKSLQPSPNETVKYKSEAKEMEKKKASQKRRKKDRKPWRAQTAYEIFCEWERPKLKEK
jgi:hypothetical protein